jgi:hypothetical protein
MHAGCTVPNASRRVSVYVCMYMCDNLLGRSRGGRTVPNAARLQFVLRPSMVGEGFLRALLASSSRTKVT